MNIISVDGCEKAIEIKNGWAYEILPSSGTRTGHCWEVKSDSFGHSIVTIWSNVECKNVTVKVNIKEK